MCLGVFLSLDFGKYKYLQSSSIETTVKGKTR